MKAVVIGSLEVAGFTTSDLRKFLNEKGVTAVFLADLVSYTEIIRELKTADFLIVRTYALGVLEIYALSFYVGYFQKEWEIVKKVRGKIIVPIPITDGYSWVETGTHQRFLFDEHDAVSLQKTILDVLAVKS